MKYETLKKVNDAIFRRSTGVKKKTFEVMLNLLETAYKKKKAKGGSKSKLSVAEMLLMALEYLREYRTYLQIGLNYGVSESTAYKHIVWVENILVKSKEFALPSKKELYNNNDIILIDVTESPVERPKKKTETILLRKKEATHYKDPGNSKQTN